MARNSGALKVAIARDVAAQKKLATQLGLGVGISSGANILGALMVQNELGRDAVVVTVLSDDNKKYLSTDLMRNEPMKPLSHLSRSGRARIVGGAVATAILGLALAGPSYATTPPDSFADLAAKAPEEKMVTALQKCWAKMTPSSATR